LKSQSVDQEPTNIAIDVENEVQDTQIKTKTTNYFNAEGNLQSQSQVPIKVMFVLSIILKKKYVFCKTFLFYKVYQNYIFF